MFVHETEIKIKLPPSGYPVLLRGLALSSLRLNPATNPRFLTLTLLFLTQDGCHKVRRPIPKFLRGGPSAASQGSAVAPMTGTIVKVGILWLAIG